MSDFFSPPEIVPPSEYLFVFEEPDNGWWLKISNANDLVDYHLKTEGIYADCMSDYMENKEKYDETGMYDSFNSTLTYAIVRFAEDNHLTIIDAIIQFRLAVAQNQLKAIHESGYIVMNSVGGFHPGPIEYSQFVRQKKFLWPDFKESDIRIKQFPGGNHYYVHIGNMELHEGKDIKWDTYEQARSAALRYVT